MILDLVKRAFDPWDDTDWAKYAGTYAEPVAAGVSVDESSAFNYSAYWAGIQVIAGALASLPLPTYKRLPDGGREVDTDHPLYNLLHHRPNPAMTSYTFREMMQEKIFTWGNAYAGIIRGRRGGYPRELWPINPANIELKRQQKSKKLYYEFKPTDSGVPIALRTDQVFHVRNMASNGLVGRSLVSIARESLGVGLAHERFEANFYGQSAVPSGVLEIPEILGDKPRKALIESLRNEANWENKRRPMILEGGTKWNARTVPQSDAQFLESRRFSVEVWARWFNMPVSFLREMTNSAVRANIEEESLNIVLYTFRPWAVRWEQEFQRQLFLEEDAGKYFAEFNFDGLLRGNAITQAEVLAKEFQNGATTINEMRKLKNRNAIGEDGDRHYVPINMVPIDKVDDVLDPDPVPAAVPNPKQAKEPVKEEPKGKRSATAPLKTLAIRWRAIGPHDRLFVDAIGRVVRKEVKAGKAAVRKYLKGEQAKNLLAWIDEFYTKQIEEIRANIHPAVSSLAEQLWGVVSPLLGGEEGAPAELGTFAREYSLGAGKRYSGYSRNQLEKIIEEADGAGLHDAIWARLTEWNESRAETAGRRELYQAGNALSLEIFRLLGVREKIWVTGCASDNPCAALSGRIVPVSDPFVRKGEVIELAGGEQFTMQKDRLHPPLDTDCVCQIEAVL